MVCEAIGGNIALKPWEPMMDADERREGKTDSGPLVYPLTKVFKFTRRASAFIGGNKTFKTTVTADGRR
jgi:hypothetical protein